MAVDAMTEEEEMAADTVMIADLQIIAACGSSYCLSAVADVAMAVADTAMAVADTAMTVACGSSYYSSAVADLEMAVADVVAAAVATTAASSHLSKQLRRLFYKVKMREIRLNLPRLLTYYFSSVSK